MTVQRILVAIDFSPQSEAAVACALSFARAFDASVTLLHVYELPTMMNPIVPGADNEDDAAVIRDGARDRLAGVRDRLTRNDPRAPVVALETVVAGGTPAEAILAHAQAGGFDLVVLGTHGRSGLQRLLVGSVAEEVVRRAPVPVVTVHQRRSAHQRKERR